MNRTWTLVFLVSSFVICGPAHADWVAFQVAYKCMPKALSLVAYVASSSNFGQPESGYNLLTSGDINLECMVRGHEVHALVGVSEPDEHAGNGSGSALLHWLKVSGKPILRYQHMSDISDHYLPGTKLPPILIRADISIRGKRTIKMNLCYADKWTWDTNFANVQCNERQLLAR